MGHPLKYRDYSNALHCYSLIHGYIFDEIDPILYRLCSHIKKLLFSKILCCFILFNPKSFRPRTIRGIANLGK